MSNFQKMNAYVFIPLFNLPSLFMCDPLYENMTHIAYAKHHFFYVVLWSILVHWPCLYPPDSSCICWSIKKRAQTSYCCLSVLWWSLVFVFLMTIILWHGWINFMCDWQWSQRLVISSCFSICLWKTITFIIQSSHPCFVIIAWWSHV